MPHLVYTNTRKQGDELRDCAAAGARAQAADDVENEDEDIGDAEAIDGCDP
jgi:hypothetical protein